MFFFCYYYSKNRGLIAENMLVYLINKNSKVVKKLTSTRHVLCLNNFIKKYFSNKYRKISNQAKKLSNLY